MNLPTHEEEKVIETMLKKIMPAFIAGTAIATTVNVLAKPNIPYERPILKAEYRRRAGEEMGKRPDCRHSV